MNVMKKQKGFTIVELLIVIVIIAILAAITVVAYNGIQNRANDAKVVSVANSLEKAIRIWNTETGNQPLSGATSTGPMPSNPAEGETCPGATSASGWVSAGYSCTLGDMLKAHGKIPVNLFSPLAYTDLMFYRCTAVANGQAYILMWRLRSPSSSDDNNARDEFRKCTNNSSSEFSASTYYTNYAMRGVKFIQL